MARGYQKGTPSAFADSLTISHGNRSHHIWSYLAGWSDASSASVDDNCPCAVHPGLEPNSSVGMNYHCEAGTDGATDTNDYFLPDSLWDGSDCPTGNICCDNPNLPRFYKELDMVTMDDVEVSICTDEDFNNEAILVDQMEL